MVDNCFIADELDRVHLDFDVIISCVSVDVVVTSVLPV